MLEMFKAAGKSFMQDKGMAFSAAVAFYTALSFAPLVLLLVTVGTFLGESQSNDLIRFFENQVGQQAGDVAESVVEQGAPADGGTLRVVIGAALLLFAASGVFAQLQAALNYIWEIEPKPGQGVWGWVRKRLLSMGMVFAILFILIVALVVSAVLDQLVGAGGAAAARVVSTVVSLLVFTALFALLFKVLPDATVPWRSVWLGAAVTAVLFLLGRAGVTLYLEHSSVTDNYGAAAGSMIAMLIWVYFSAIIFFYGAELTQQHARRRYEGIEPEQHARRAPRQAPADKPRA